MGMFCLEFLEHLSMIFVSRTFYVTYSLLLSSRYFLFGTTIRTSVGEDALVGENPALSDYKPAPWEGWEGGSVRVCWVWLVVFDLSMYVHTSCVEILILCPPPPTAT